MTWQEQAKALFFIEKKTIKEVSQDIYKSERSIRQYLKTLPQYKKEREKRKTENREKRKAYQRQWDRVNRRYCMVNGESIKREHTIAAIILSKEKY